MITAVCAAQAIGGALYCILVKRIDVSVRARRWAFAFALALTLWTLAAAFVGDYHILGRLFMPPNAMVVMALGFGLAQRDTTRAD